MYNHQLQIRYRALDLLSEWIDGYYQFDFKTDPSLIEELLGFVKDEVRFHFVPAYFLMLLVLGKATLWPIIVYVRSNLMAGFRNRLEGKTERRTATFSRTGLHVRL